MLLYHKVNKTSLTKLLGTPLHQPEEDQQILPNAIQQQQVPPLTPVCVGGMTPTLGLGMGMGMIPPTKHTYVPGFATPQSIMQPQTPV